MGISGIVELVKLGSLGFSIAIMIFTFILLKKIIQTDTFEGEALKIRCKEIRIYMVMSIVVIIIGMVWELNAMDPKVTVTFDVSPQDIEGYIVKVGGELIDIKKQRSFEVKDRYQIFVDLVRMDRRIAKLNNKVSYLESQVKGSEQLVNDIKRAQFKNQIINDKINDEIGISSE